MPSTLFFQNKQATPLSGYCMEKPSDYYVPLLQQPIAKEKAHFHLTNALDIKAAYSDRPIDAEGAVRIMEHLYLAISFGSSDAATEFSNCMSMNLVPHRLNEKLVILKELADQGNGAAALAYACIHNAGMKNRILSGNRYLLSEECENIAITYFKKGIILNNEPCRLLLFNALIVNSGGAIKANYHRWIDFCTQISEIRNVEAQMMTSDFGALLCGFKLNGQPFTHSNIKINQELGLNYLLRATSGVNIKVAINALALFCKSLSKGLGQVKPNMDMLRNKLIDAAYQHNQLIIIYLSWLNLPLNKRFILNLLATPIRHLIQTPLDFSYPFKNNLKLLRIASQGADPNLSNLAKQLLKVVKEVTLESKLASLHSHTSRAA